ncbi:efflux RND transporter periplasmic adaptor subunit [Paraburkholderia sp. BCC1886]|uniref:efflux RND transporter periplasmic adaptor subunit n=1 Tax=Paraburkholderia sp. BCC1886 TaxID=2562670 RepID=UPI0011822DCA|nr:efflux RND transporter periplasmic adaptor subunit [Paraburkholderia sp. BCC1886]
MHRYVLHRAAALGVVGVLAGCGQSNTADPRTGPPLVESYTVQPAGTAERSFTGVIAARVESDLGFRVGGKIIQRFVDVGQHVHRGDPLMRLDPDDLSLGVTAQQGAVEAARARSVKADADLARLQGLVQQGAVSAQDYDLAVEAARSARAQLDAAQAQSGLARNADQYALLRADVDGVVLSRQADAGQVVNAGQTVLVVAQDGPREAFVTLPEMVRPSLGSDATATLYGDGKATYPARLRELSHSADPLTRTYAARYVLSGDAADAPFGATVTVNLPQAANTNAMTVPLGAILDRGRGPGVWLIGADEHLTYRAVQVSSAGAETATVTAGLAAGQKIVALGAHQLNDGEQIRVASQQWTDASASGTADAGADAGTDAKTGAGAQGDSQ